MFLFLNGPLLNAQSTFMIWVSNSVPSISFIAFCASSNFSYSIKAYPYKAQHPQQLTDEHLRPNYRQYIVNRNMIDHREENKNYKLKLEKGPFRSSFKSISLLKGIQSYSYTVRPPPNLN